jgi:hypothetical protein
MKNNKTQMSGLDCENVSLLSLQRMLTDDGYRAGIVRQVKDPIWGKPPRLVFGFAVSGRRHDAGTPLERRQIEFGILVEDSVLAQDY